MAIDELNRCIDSTGLDTLSKIFLDPESKNVSILLVNDSGGEFENKSLEVKFIESVAFHLPQYMSVTLCFNVEESSEAARYIPEISFDPEEFSDNGFKIFTLNDAQKPTGFYVAAMNVEFELLEAG